jgi:DNA polymerase-1
MKMTYKEIDQHVEPILRSMEKRGITLNGGYLRDLADEFGTALADLEEQIHDSVGHQFLISSPKQLQQVLYHDLKLTSPQFSLRRTKTGTSTAASELNKLIDVHPVIPLILKWREKAKLLSTYLLPLPEMVGEDGRLHTHFRQDTHTGRLSSSAPNLQNIPAKSEDGARIRTAFVAGPGNVLISADYAQLELRIAAWLGKDASMLQAFQEGRDIHTETAQQLKVDRRVAKAINFGLIFGKGAYTLAEELGTSREQAQEFIDRYFDAFPGMRAGMDHTLSELHAKGSVKTLFGRKRYFPEIKSGNRMLVGAAERAALNHPIQGTEAEIIKLAMITLEKSLPNTLILQVHDELLFEIEKGKEKTLAPIIAAGMEEINEIELPLKVELKSGPNWGELEKL